MKIRVKKEMRLDELIKWAWDNPELVRGKNFYPQCKSNETYVYFHLYDGRKCLINDFISADDTFEVGIEEEITEDTEFDCLLELNDIEGFKIYENESIRDLIDGTSRAFYILNEDKTMTLIWKDGRLVE
ncbi:hypothetical protein [Staphylococcus aureus]|uniref:hypothetical protein n=1 Tax=Staphylococcus aureus TaxID=1280 RepID=UPI001E5EBEB1|nr:hypothetical protein [Staphylococcus aureus]UFA55743.1 hypothetical protein LB315_11990 [Staphylococcus aureus]